MPHPRNFSQITLPPWKAAVGDGILQHVQQKCTFRLLKPTVGWFGFVYGLHVFALAHCFASLFLGLAKLALGVLPLTFNICKITQIQKCFQREPVATR